MAQQHDIVATLGDNLGDLTIGKAKELFQKVGRALYSDDGGLAELFKRNGWENGLKNDNYVHALFLTDLMMKGTTTAFRMLTGSSGDGFLGALRKSFETMLDRLERARGSARIILLGGEGNDFLNEFKSVKPSSLQVRLLPGPTRVNMGHFITCDSSMVREEEPHPELTDASRADLVKATVFFSNPIKTAIANQKFDAIWGLLPETDKAARS